MQTDHNITPIGTLNTPNIPFCKRADLPLIQNLPVPARSPSGYFQNRWCRHRTYNADGERCIVHDWLTVRVFKLKLHEKYDAAAREEFPRGRTVIMTLGAYAHAHMEEVLNNLIALDEAPKEYKAQIDKFRAAARKPKEKHHEKAA